jgi:hypothetical protein
MTVPVVVVEQTINIIKQLSFGTSGRPICAQSKVSVLLARLVDKLVRDRVAVIPKLPAVKVEADRVTEFMPLIHFPALAEISG